MRSAIMIGLAFMLVSTNVDASHVRIRRSGSTESLVAFCRSRGRWPYRVSRAKLGKLVKLQSPVNERLTILLSSYPFKYEGWLLEGDWVWWKIVPCEGGKLWIPKYLGVCGNPFSPCKGIFVPARRQVSKATYTYASACVNVTTESTSVAKVRVTAEAPTQPIREHVEQPAPLAKTPRTDIPASGFERSKTEGVAGYQQDRKRAEFREIERPESPVCPPPGPGQVPVEPVPNGSTNPQAGLVYPSKPLAPGGPPPK